MGTIACLVRVLTSDKYQPFRCDVQIGISGVQFMSMLRDRLIDQGMNSEFKLTLVDHGGSICESEKQFISIMKQKQDEDGFLQLQVAEISENPVWGFDVDSGAGGSVVNNSASEIGVNDDVDNDAGGSVVNNSASEIGVNDDASVSGSAVNDARKKQLQQTPTADSSSSFSTVWTSTTEDQLHLFFTHLPLHSIYRFRCLSKNWSRILSSHDFIKEWFKVRGNSLPLFYYHTMYHSLYSFTDQDFRYAYQESNSDFASKNEYLLSLQFFLKNIPSGEELILLGSSDGLVLCHTPNLYNKYHVCNPLTRSWVSLPPPPAQDSTEDIEEYEDNADVGGIYCYNSSESSNRCYKVVRVQEFDLGTKKLKVDVYSSDLGVWESFQVSCDRIVTFNGEPDTQEYAFVKSSNSQIRIVRGVIYWIAATKLLICNLNQSGEHLCEYIDMPRDDRGEDWETCAWVLWESEGSVGVAKASEGTVSVWRVSRYFELQEPCYWEELYWKVSLEPVFEIVRSREKQLPDSIGLTGILPDSIVLIGISHVDHNVVLLYRCPWVWGFNLITRAVEELCLSNKEIAAIRCPFVLKPMTTNV